MEVRGREKVKKLKVGDKFNIIKEKIKARPLKYVKPILFFIILSYPLNSYAEETIKLLDKTDTKTCPNMKLYKFHHFAIALFGLKKCLDPRLTIFQKALYCTRPCCLLAGLTAGYIAENSSVGSKTHIVATACCLSSWNAYGRLLIYTI